MQALEAVLALPADPQRTRYVVFLTDGAVSAEARALEHIRGRIGSARLFTFGVGPSVNRALLGRMANLGRGRSTFLQLDEDIEGAIIRFQDSVSLPVLTNLALEWHNGKAWDIYPERIPDLYDGQPVELCGRVALRGHSALRLTVRGQRGTEAVQLTLEVPVAAGRDDVIGRVWAKARVDHLLEQQALDPGRADQLRNEIIRLALDTNLVTPYTSFIAIDRETARGEGQPRVIHVAQPLPQSLQPGAFGPTRVGGVNQLAAIAGGPAPRMASKALSHAPQAMAASFTMNSPEADLKRRIAESRVPEPTLLEPEATLRWLARVQKLDGSWESSVEWTAAALLAFVRNGHTTRVGAFRQALRRAAGWLSAQVGHGFASFARALALEELASATGDDRDTAAAREARQALPAPSTLLEQAASGVRVEAPELLRNLDDLRLAAVLKASLPVPEALLQGMERELARVWAAALPIRK